MVYYDHGMLGATVALAVGAQRRHGWPIIVLAALAGMFPDWDAFAKHVSRETYVRVHRVWGHNIFAVTIAGVALGALGYWLDRSLLRRPEPGSDTRGGLGYWIALGVLITWTHPLMDLLYCGMERTADWPVGSFWPLVPTRYGQPWMPWRDWGATLILLAGLLVVGVNPRRGQRWACVSFCVLALYVGMRGASWI